jgi:hypothetical protein
MSRPEEQINKQTPKYAKYKLDTGHKYNTIKETMEVLDIEKKGQLLSTRTLSHIQFD